MQVCFLELQTPTQRQGFLVKTHTVLHTTTSGGRRRSQGTWARKAQGPSFRPGLLLPHVLATRFPLSPTTPRHPSWVGHHFCETLGWQMPPGQRLPHHPGTCPSCTGPSARLPALTSCTAGFRPCGHTSTAEHNCHPATAGRDVCPERREMVPVSPQSSEVMRMRRGGCGICMKWRSLTNF